MWSLQLRSGRAHWGAVPSEIRSLQLRFSSAHLGLELQETKGRKEGRTDGGKEASEQASKQGRKEVRRQATLIRSRNPHPAICQNIENMVRAPAGALYCL